MFLGGLWHGAGVNFIVWGSFHGLLLLAYHRIEKPWAALPRLLQRSVMILVLVCSWIPFRMHTMQELQAFGTHATLAPHLPTAPLQLWASALLGGGLCVLPRNSNEIRWGELGWPATLALALLVVVAVLHLNLSSKFIYFAF